MIVRDAIDADTPALLAIGQHFHAGTSYAQHSSFCPETARSRLALCREAGALLVAEVDGQPAGMFGFVAVPSLPNNAVLGASEMLFFVAPAAQDQGAGRALLRAAKDRARDMGLAYLQSHTLPESPPQLEALYRAEGLAHTETSFTVVL